MKINRQDIADLLLKWLNNNISEKDVLEWARRYYNLEYINDFDWENGNSVINEVLSVLDGLDMNLVLKEDIPVYLKFLSTPLGQFDKGYKNWNSYMESINYDARKKILRDNQFYSIYCT